MSASRCSMTKGASGSARPPRFSSSSARRPLPALAGGSLIRRAFRLGIRKRRELGQLRPFRTLEADLDLAIPDTRLEARLLEHRRALHHRAAAEVEAGAMPRADDGIALARSLGERSSQMGARIGERARLACLRARKQHRHAIHIHLTKLLAS